MPCGLRKYDSGLRLKQFFSHIELAHCFKELNVFLILFSLLKLNAKRHTSFLVIPKIVFPSLNNAGPEEPPLPYIKLVVFSEKYFYIRRIFT